MCEAITSAGHLADPKKSELQLWCLQTWDPKMVHKLERSEFVHVHLYDLAQVRNKI